MTLENLDLLDLHHHLRENYGELIEYRHGDSMDVLTDVILGKRPNLRGNYNHYSETQQ